MNDKEKLIVEEREALFRSEVERLRLTAAERECIEWAEEIAGNCEEFDRVSTLRGLLNRLGG